MELFLTIPNRINFLKMGRFGHPSEQQFRMNFRKPFDWLSYNWTFVRQDGNPRRRYARSAHKVSILISVKIQISCSWNNVSTCAT